MTELTCQLLDEDGKPDAPKAASRRISKQIGGTPLSYRIRIHNESARTGKADGSYPDIDA